MHFRQKIIIHFTVKMLLVNYTLYNKKNEFKSYHAEEHVGAVTQSGWMLLRGEQ